MTGSNSSDPTAAHLAMKTFMRHKEFYHPIAAKMLASDLGADARTERVSGSSGLMVSVEDDAGTNGDGTSKILFLGCGTLMKKVCMGVVVIEIPLLASYTIQMRRN